MIFKIKKTERFTVLFNSMLQDDTLSYEARGVLSMLLSFPPDWEIKVEDLIRRGGLKPNGKKRYGRDSMYGIIKELKAAGYIIGKAKQVGGVFQGYDYCVYEEPQKEPLTDSSDTAIPQPLTDLPDAAIQETNTKDFGINKTIPADKPQAKQRKKEPVLTEEQKAVHAYMLNGFEKGYEKLTGTPMPQKPKEYVALSELCKYFARCGGVPTARAYMGAFYEMVFKHDRLVEGFGFVPSALNMCLTRIAGRIGGMNDKDTDALRYGSVEDREKVRDKASTEGFL